MQRIAFVIFIGALLATQQVNRRAPAAPKKVDYSKFNHATHRGKVDGVLKKGSPQELNCAYCHQTPRVDAPAVTGFPNAKPDNKVTHSACTDCHAMTGREATSVEQTYPKMCLICHASTRLSELASNIRVFPNPESGPESQFYDNYSHSDHTGYSDGSALFKERFKDKKKYKERDNFECVACHTITEPVMIAKSEFAAGVKASAPSHASCFSCHFNEKEVPAKSASFATNCIGCHSLEKKAKGAGSEHSVLWFNREVIAPERNTPKPGAKPLLPFSHKTHEDAVGSDTKSCLECHATGKRADKRSDFFLPDKRTQEKQPRAGNCVECHRKEMQTKIEGAVTLATAKCNYCHSLTTIQQRAGAGTALPPPSHFYKKPAATPAATTPATTPVAAPPPTAKPTPTPTPKPLTR